MFAALVGAAPARADDWHVQVTPFNQIFPALDLSQANRRSPARDVDGARVVGSGNGLIAVQLTAQHDRESVHLEIASGAWLPEPARLDAVLDTAGTKYELRPVLAWDAPRLSAQIQPTPATLRFSLQRDARPADVRDVEVSLRPLNEALYFVRDGADSVDLSWIFAAFVNENDAVVDRVLALGMQSAIVDAFDGYASASPDDVLRQAWAIWHALSARGIRYSGADPGVDRGPRVFSQRVRFLADTWNDRSANCIDGSALLASALQRIGLRSFLVLVPGHALVGFYADANSRHALYLETTLLGTHVAALQSPPAYAADADTSAATRASLASFDAALRAGAARYARVATKLDGRHRPDYAVIDVRAAREFGIQPIAPQPSSGAGVMQSLQPRGTE
ncbi:MAG: hypothetical protein ABI846_00695 [Rudaea sp.]